MTQKVDLDQNIMRTSCSVYQISHRRETDVLLHLVWGEGTTEEAVPGALAYGEISLRSYSTDISSANLGVIA